jgi:hypothetical protein
VNREQSGWLSAHHALGFALSQPNTVHFRLLVPTCGRLGPLPDGRGSVHSRWANKRNNGRPLPFVAARSAGLATADGLLENLDQQRCNVVGAALFLCGFNEGLALLRQWSL